MGSGGLPGSWCKLCWAYCTLGHTRPPCTDQKGSTGHEGVIEDAFLPDPDAAARGKATYLPVGSGPLATGFGALAGSYRLAASYLSSRSSGTSDTGALPPGPIQNRG